MTEYHIQNKNIHLLSDNTDKHSYDSSYSSPGWIQAINFQYFCQQCII